MTQLFVMNAEIIPNKNLVVKTLQKKSAGLFPVFDKKTFDYLKEQSLKYFLLYQKAFPEQFKKSERIASCSQCLTYEVYKHTVEQDTYKTSMWTYTCKDPFCPFCQRNKSRRLFTEMYHTLSYLEDLAGRQYSYYFLTLTVKNPPISELRDTLKHMSKAFQMMFIRSDSKVFKPIRRVVKGYYRTLEYLGSNTPPGEAHPHYHILLVMPKYYKPSRKEYISSPEWSSMWKHALKVDYDPIIDIQRVRPSRKKGATHSAMVSAIAEVTKYSVKPSSVFSLSLNDFRHLIIQTKGVQTFSRSKYFRQLKDLLKTTPEQEEEESKLWVLVMSEYYRYSSGGYLLTKSEYNQFPNSSPSVPSG